MQVIILKIKSKSLEEFEKTVLTVIVEQLNSQKDGFQTSLIFSDYSLKYAVKIYDIFANSFNKDSYEEAQTIVNDLESQMSEKYADGLFVDFKYLNFGYSEFLKWLEEFKYNFWFKTNGYIFNYEILNDETIEEEYVKIYVEKSRLIL